MTYYGDTKEKKLARTYAALASYEAFRSYQPDVILAEAVTLAGNSAGDLGILKHLWKFPAEACHFTDSDAAAVASSKAILDTEWPGVHLRKESLIKTLDRINHGIDYLVLDFMGQFNHKVAEVLAVAKDKMLPGSIVNYTFCRSHETDANPYWRETERFGEESKLSLIIRHRNDPEEMAALSRDRRRFVGYAHLLREGLATDGYYWRLIAKYKYHMGIIVLQKLPLGHGIKNVLSQAISVDNDDVVFRNLVCDLQKKKFNAKQISEIIQVPKGRVAAWMANNTRGAYK